MVNYVYRPGLNALFSFNIPANFIEPNPNIVSIERGLIDNVEVKKKERKEKERKTFRSSVF